MHVDKLSSFEQETLNRFLLHHMGLETRGKLMVEFPVIYRKLLGRRAGSAFADAVKKAVLEDEPRLCACGQLFTTDEQNRECEKNELRREQEELEEDELDTMLANLEEDE
jgi:hypothetical protein